MTCGHYKNVCSCGAVISQCRCPGPKSERVIPKGCMGCARESAITEDMAQQHDKSPAPIPMSPNVYNAMKQLGEAMQAREKLHTDLGGAVAAAMNNEPQKGLGAIADSVKFTENMRTVDTAERNAIDALRREARAMVKP